MKRASSFASIQLKDNENLLASEIILWRTVLDQAVEDFLCKDIDNESHLNKQRAKVWLRGNSPDFFKVCELALLDSHMVRSLIFKIVGGRDALV